MTNPGREGSAPAARPWLRLLRETLLVAVLGAGAALLANWVSPRGLALTRDYFPPAPAIARPAAAEGSRPSDTATVDAPRRPSSSAVPLIDLAEAVRLFRDPDYDRELIIMVDARNAQQYAAGHIPGAYQFDRYHPEQHLALVLPACLAARRVVVYCTGGECEDSHFAARALQDAGVPAESVVVLAAGFAEWKSHRLPVELGERRSGRLQPENP